MRIIPTGILLEMATRNRQRLQADFYQAEEIYLDKNDQWSGDWQGRDLLAQLSHTLIFGQETDALPALLEQLPAHLNEQGYFGCLADPAAINEQQLAGNGWFLRALCLWYEMGGDALPMIRRVVENLYLPLLPAVQLYPVEYGAAVEGRFDGNLRTGTVGGFQLSTDVGCFYIALDGLAHAYHIAPSQELKALIESMIRRFRQTDVVGNRFQTHATLAALRGILRFAMTTGDASLLSFVETIFAEYQKYGMTLNFANYNWFGRPEWTEPCAVVDSFMLARRLYRCTEKMQYLKLSYQIFYNALVFALRDNGGFGCDKCATEDQATFRPDPGAYDAYWCCTMRGAEGLRDSLQLTSKEGICQIDFITEGIYAWGNGSRIQIQTRFPYESDIRISSCDGYPAEPFRLLLPVESRILSCTGCKAEMLEQGYLVTQTEENFTLDIQAILKPVKVPCKGGYVCDYGVLRLCTHEAPSPLRLTYEGRQWKAVPWMWKVSQEEGLQTTVKLLFE